MKILVIPDTQTKPGVPIGHLSACGHYIVDKKPDVVVHIGDHWDMPSLSSYDKKTSRCFEGRRVLNDIKAGNEAMAELMAPLESYNRKQRAQKGKQYKPRKVFCLGNHEARIARAIEDNPSYEGLLGYDRLALGDWEVHGFLDIVNIHDILFSHYFVNTSSLLKGTLGGTIEGKLQRIGNSFVMGHQQTLQFGARYLNDGTAHIGLVAGAFYQHHEDYMGPQGNHHWRGCVMLNDVRDGKFDPMFLSLDYLLRRYT